MSPRPARIADPPPAAAELPFDSLSPPAGIGACVPTNVRSALPPEDDEFRWDSENEDIIVPDQSALAIYVNRWNQVVIREERSWDRDEDWYIRISRENLPSVIKRLQTLLTELG